MTIKNIGILHPGEMGISIAASAQKSGRTVHWASESRSPQTKARAEKNGLKDVSTLTELCKQCEAIICVCPPHAAEDVAQQVLARGFRGLYVDANAISPERAKSIGRAVDGSGADFVDGGIIGGPAWQPNSTWLHLSGKQAAEVAALFVDGPLETNILSDSIGDASAIKMCFAAFTKGRTALLCAILGTAESLGVRQSLAEQWKLIGYDLADSTPQRARRVTAKAWRFVGEMDEIASTFAGEGMPAGFHQAAGEIYRRLAHFKGASETPSIEEVLEALLERIESSGSVSDIEKP